MKWYWHIAGDHAHVRVFLNGRKCGDLCFGFAEFQDLLVLMKYVVVFIEDERS